MNRRQYLRTLLLITSLSAHAAADDAVNQAQQAADAFSRAGPVFQHPRCVNCHTAGNTPLHGDDGRVHDFNVVRGTNDRGRPGLECAICHQSRNMAGIPGAPKWQLAPPPMSWGTASVGDICRNITDLKRNGNRLPIGIVLHVTNDPLVVWAWDPGDGRSPPPLPFDDFIALMTRWSNAGAHCPE